MKKTFFGLTFWLILLFWPISLLQANPVSWPTYFMASLIVILDWFLYFKGFVYHYFLYLLLPLVTPVYLPLPIIYLLFNLDLPVVKKPAPLTSYLVLTAIVGALSFGSFLPRSVFTPDPVALGTLHQKNSLIPQRFLAKIMANQTTIFQTKFTANLFSSFDINNYFFGFHPREIAKDNQNLSKYPYLALAPFLVGLFFLTQNTHRRWLAVTLLAAIISLATIGAPDKFDFIIYWPISLMIYYGLKKIYRFSGLAFWLFTVIFLPISLIELARLILLR